MNIIWPPGHGRMRNLMLLFLCGSLVLLQVSNTRLFSIFDTVYEDQADTSTSGGSTHLRGGIRTYNYYHK